MNTQTEPIIAQKSSYKVDVEKGKTYYWCACGLSTKQPFCDGSHIKTTLSPITYEASQTKSVYFCGCKKTVKSPLCDGTHKSL